MAKYQITAPDGSTYEVTAPDGASEQEVLSFAQSKFQARADQLESDRKTFAPTVGMGPIDRFLAGAGQGASRMGRAIMQGLGQRTDEQMAEANRLDASLMDTGMGKAGSVLGSVAALAPTMLIPGVNTYAGATALGTATGFATTEGDLKDRAKGAAFGGAGGAVGKLAGDKLGAWLAQRAQAGQAQAAANAAQNATKDATLTAGRTAGYVVPPSQVQGSSVIPRIAEGLGGKIKTEQAASVANQNVTNALARKALGMNPNAPLTVDALEAIRKTAGTAYDAVKQAGTVTTGTAYTQALDDAIAPFVSQARSFPNRKMPAVVDEIQALKTGQFDASDAIETIKVLRNDADAAYRAGDKLTGKAYKKAVDALEQAIDDHLVNSGAPAGLLNGYRDARKLIAKSYTVETALNQGSGNIRANRLASMLDKKKPLSGELKEAAQFAQQFPKATQEINGVAPYSVLDAFAGGLGLGVNPMITAGVLSRPLARAAVLNPTVQRMAVNPSYGANNLSNMLAPVLQTTPANMLLRTAPIGLVPAYQ